jgi:hypothetical protein
MGRSHVDLLNDDSYDDSRREIRTSAVRPLKKSVEDWLLQPPIEAAACHHDVFKQGSVKAG